MIRVNLFGEHQDHSALYALQLFAAGGAIAVLVLVITGFHASQVSKNSELEHTRTQLNTQLEKLKEKTRKVDELEKKRKLLGEKLTTIATLKARKQGPARLLDNLTVSIPKRAWVSAVAQKGETVEFTGVALDNQTVSEFMTNLRSSPFFKDVDLGVSKHHMHDGVKLQQFTLTAKLSDPLMRAKFADSQNAQAANAVAEAPAEERQLASSN